MTEGNDVEMTKQRHPVRNWAIAISVVVLVFIVWFGLAISSDNAYKDEARQACADDVAAKYHDREATVYASLEGRDDDRLEYTVVDSLAEFHWTCFVTKSGDELVVDSFK